MDTSKELPSALAAFDDIAQRLQERRLAVFLDYDGTLTPIVATPEQALLSDRARSSVSRLASLCPVAVVSGRDRLDVEALVGLDIVYAGSHGFDIAGPNGLVRRHDEAEAFLTALDTAERALRARLEDIQGALVERKRYTIAVHYRNVDDSRAPVVEQIVDAVMSENSALRKKLGKKVFELQPDIDWHKGRAVLWLLQALGLADTDVLPIYVGDDVTDEDAFRAIDGIGIGVVVQEQPAPTAASYRLRDTEEVRALLERLADVMEARI